ncbi:hypothetical protein EMIHUDRAFT_230936 [Emiliania huxleyi CCMP1516]|uniref:Uncharacterized protein n=2 Tax=Emiliania huxleyi TaxID=2903 RepID=A0A0D3K9F2_EMIH1|nr:hypothetical protein EMIHUDRAFT_230936 [Emiliania huxleyi CCMP1516]EOD32387.1 hypothetical protein EMIHUDRAFT_230936 [Emiliania huxleyi CCMP1516]|eukprot:XP_005784816.1 hypothetical protein EMIHUDRAFT_230936 [Emiliania huxleyi CCMP1516]
MLDCFEWGEPPAECAAAVEHLRAAIAEGDARLDVQRRRLLLRFFTGLNALPVNGLSRKQPGRALEKLLVALDSFEADPSFGQGELVLQCNRTLMPVMVVHDPTVPGITQRARSPKKRIVTTSSKLTKLKRRIRGASGGRCARIRNGG